MVIKLAADQIGTTTITIAISDPDRFTTKTSFTLTVVPLGDPPRISKIMDQRIFRDALGPPINFTVEDKETAAEALTVTVNSGDPLLFPERNLQVQGTGATRRLLIRPAAGLVGEAQLAITVADPDGWSVNETFKVTVSIPSNPPVLSEIPDQITGRNRPIKDIPLRIRGAHALPDQLNVTVVSSNLALVPESGIQVGGVGLDRTISIQPAQNQLGVAILTVIASNERGEWSSESFSVTIPSASPPSISEIANRRAAPGSNLNLVTFTAEDLETTPEALVISARSSNQAFVADASLLLAGHSVERKLAILSSTGQSGTTTITVTVTDEDGMTASRSFQFSIVENDAPPRISIVSDWLNAPQPPWAPIRLQVEDAETPSSELVVNVVSSNPTLLPHSNIRLSGLGSLRTLILTSAPGQTGSSRVALAVIDAAGQTAAAHFDWVVESPMVASAQDINGDHRPDILFEDELGQKVFWSMAGPMVAAAGRLVLDGQESSRWTYVGMADLDEAAALDLIFQREDGTLAGWLSDVSGTLSGPMLLKTQTGDPNWRAIAAGNFHTQSESSFSLVFQHHDGTLALWSLKDFAAVTTELVEPSHPGDYQWRVVGAADFNRDSHDDLLFQHADGTLAVWYLRRNRLVGGLFLDPKHPGDGEWRVRRVADLNLDGMPDLVFQHRRDRSLAAWIMEDARLKGAHRIVPDNSGGNLTLAGP